MIVIYTHRTIAKVGRQFGGSVSLTEVFSDGDFLKQRGVFEAVLLGLTQQPVQEVDNNFVTQIIDELFDDGETGFDLVAINLQRGRDHGISGYTEYRQVCQVGGSTRKATRFSDLSSNISPDVRHNQIVHVDYELISFGREYGFWRMRMSMLKILIYLLE